MSTGERTSEVPEVFFSGLPQVKDHFAQFKMNKAASLTKGDPGAASKDRPP